MQVVRRKLWLTRTSVVRRGGNWGKLSDSWATRENLSYDHRQVVTQSLCFLLLFKTSTSSSSHSIVTWIVIWSSYSAAVSDFNWEVNVNYWLVWKQFGKDGGSSMLQLVVDLACLAKQAAGRYCSMFSSSWKHVPNQRCAFVYRTDWKSLRDWPDWIFGSPGAQLQWVIKSKPRGLLDFVVSYLLFQRQFTVSENLSVVGILSTDESQVNYACQLVVNWKQWRVSNEYDDGFLRTCDSTYQNWSSQTNDFDWLSPRTVTLRSA